MAKPLGAMKNLPLGKAVTAKITKSLATGSKLTCADNTGAQGGGAVLDRFHRSGLERPGNLEIALGQTAGK
ncbi:MAG: hypothetical protein KKB85_02030 [Candidatus Altiarchaeota archaeon]|nr:hypothetical protein [Candidatus Altiarchaeota archaeon]